MRFQLLLTGNEIMSGDTVDSNSSMIAQRLLREGYWIDRKVTVGDDMQELIDEIQSISESSDVLIINGGLGPTTDDLTAEALAQASGIELAEHPDAKHHVLTWCEKRGFKSNAANLKQAILPAGVSILQNSVGSAVGFAMTLNDCLIMCTPGVPSELRVMLDEAIVPMLATHYPVGDAPQILRYQTFGLGESGAQQMLNDAYPDWPDNIEIGFRAGAPMLEMKLRVEPSCSDEQRDHWEAKFLDVVGAYVVGRDETRLPQAIVQCLAERGEQIALAESCTGGLIASMITSVPGSSAVFEAGIVSYSNTIKQSQLGVSEKTLEQFGAVSEQCVREMAAGVLSLSNADYGVAVSGIAGPDGGTEEKPVGTVWIAWGKKDKLKAREFNYPVNRSMFQTIVSALALDLVRREILELADEPSYFQRSTRRT
ncbi:MAG: CinA family nicotinamide mononucleotide deamidase-related protein [Pseudomonadales bacterium]